MFCAHSVAINQLVSKVCAFQHCCVTYRALVLSKVRVLPTSATIKALVLNKLHVSALVSITALVLNKLHVSALVSITALVLNKLHVSLCYWWGIACVHTAAVCDFAPLPF